MLGTTSKTDSRHSLYHKDGLLDIFIGLGIFFAGLFLWTEMVWMVGIFVPVFLPSFQSARKRFFHRRQGIHYHDPQSHNQGQKVLFYMTLLIGFLVLAGVGFFYAFSFYNEAVKDWLHASLLMILGGLFASVWIFAAFELRLPRFHIYGIGTFLLLAVSQLTSLTFWMAFVILGGLIFFVGLVRFFKFLQENPLPEKGE
jgi:hypothetical protein